MLSIKTEWNKSRLNSSLVVDPLPVIMISRLCLIGEKFNDFFVSIGQNLAKKMPSQNLLLLKYIGQPLAQSMFLGVVTTDAIYKVINKRSSKSWWAICIDSIRVPSSISCPLAYLCSLPFGRGVFPREPKLAYVVPLYKADDPYNFDNYRPVSLLCVLSKIFEGLCTIAR